MTTDGGGVEFYSCDDFNRLISVEDDTGAHTYAYRPDELWMYRTVNDVTVPHI